MASSAPSEQRGVLTFAAAVRPGDEVLVDGTFLSVTEIRRAPGRKPKQGENLHLVTADTVLRCNSMDPVRVRSGADVVDR